MLRASARAFDYHLDENSLIDPAVDPGIPGGRELLNLDDALLDGGDAVAARDAVLGVLGPAGLHDAAAVFGNFEMMNRVAEATGIPVAPAALARDAGTISRLGLDRFRGHRV